MEWWMAAAWAVAAVVIAAVAAALLRSGRPVRGLLSSGIQGMCALAAVNITGAFTGVSLGVNMLTASVGVLLGAPGIIAVLLVKTILR